MKTARGSRVCLQTGAFPSQRSPRRVRSPHTNTKPRPRQQCERSLGAGRHQRREGAEARGRVQTPRDAGPGTGGLSRGSAEVAVAAGGWGPAPRGSEGRGEAQSQADPGDASLDPLTSLLCSRPHARGRGPAGLPGLGAHPGMVIQRRPLCPVLSCPSKVAGKPARQAELRSHRPGLCWGPTRAVVCESSVAHDEGRRSRTAEEPDARRCSCLRPSPRCRVYICQNYKRLARGPRTLAHTHGRR